MAVVASFPFSSVLLGELSCVGSAVLAGKYYIMLYFSEAKLFMWVRQFAVLCLRAVVCVKLFEPLKSDVLSMCAVGQEENEWVCEGRAI